MLHNLIPQQAAFDWPSPWHLLQRCSPTTSKLSSSPGQYPNISSLQPRETLNNSLRSELVRTYIKHCSGVGQVSYIKLFCNTPTPAFPYLSNLQTPTWDTPWTLFFLKAVHIWASTVGGGYKSALASPSSQLSEHHRWHDIPPPPPTTPALCPQDSKIPVFFWLRPFLGSR